MSAEKLLDLLTTRGDLLDDHTLIERRRIPSTESSAVSVSGSEGSVVIHKDSKTTQDQSLRIRTKDLESEDDFNDYVIEPALPPPKELDPDKLYALYEFSGDDPSHCELERDDAVVLLNDQDSYWWLVRKEKNGMIGFAPAECLETYDERLARLNCWKNEELERNSKETLEVFPQTSIEKMNKSVTFSEKITITEHDSGNDDNDNDRDDYLHEMVEDDDDTDDYFENPDRELGEDILTDMEANSDVLSNSGTVSPLVLKKKSKSRSQLMINQMIPESEAEESPFIQPYAFFSNNNGSGSIGTYSPSSSEFDSPGNTPPLNQYRRKPVITSEQFERKGNIPQSKGTRDIAKSMQMLDELINDELNTAATFDGDSDVDITLTYDDDDTDKLSSPISLEDKNKNLSNITSSSFTNSNTSLHQSASQGTDSSTEDLSVITGKPAEIHPEIESIFKDSLGRMNDLAQKLKDLDRLLE
jgi:hypothetical protein